jgi:FG-GAP-like repeat/Salmonella virulence plasmid 65kDa B protein
MCGCLSQTAQGQTGLYQTRLNQAAFEALTPNTTNAIGSVAGSHGVSLSGTATYTIPFAIPAGTDGMQPALSLAYNSQGANSYYGTGWQLTGLSSIGYTHKDKLRDGWAKEITLDGTDALTLDGNRLILSSGVYGADGSTYRTESETFAKIFLQGSLTANNCFFTVIAKTGLRTVYEPVLKNTNNTRVLLWLLTKAYDTHGNYMTYYYGNGVDGRELLLNRVEYTGNATATPILLPTYKVQMIYNNGVDRIDKTSSYIAGNKVSMTSLLTEVRIIVDNQIMQTYQFGYTKNTITTLLQTVTEYAEGSNLTTTKKLNNLTFQYPNEAAYNVQLSAHVQSLGLETGIPANYGNNYLPGDFNGDGYTDLLRYEKVQWQEKKFGWLFADVNVNGGCNLWANANDNNKYGFNYDNVRIQYNNAAPDIFTGAATTFSLNSTVYNLPKTSMTAICRPVGWTQDNDQSLKTIYSANNIASVNADFDGDGADDMVTVVTQPRSLYRMTANWGGNYLGDKIDGIQIRTKLQDGTGTVIYRQLPQSPSSTIQGRVIEHWGHAWDNRGINVVEVGDYDGDGRTDVAVVTRAAMYWVNFTPMPNTGIEAYLGSNVQDAYLTSTVITIFIGLAANNFNLQKCDGGLNDYTPQSYTYLNYLSLRDMNVKSLDIDGNKKTDIMITDANSMQVVGINSNLNNEVQIATLSTTSHNFPTLLLPTPSYYVGDFNGDGKPDLFYARPSFFVNDGTGAEIRYSNGSSFTESSYLPSLGVNTGYSQEKQYIIADFNGDGKSDILTAIKTLADYYLIVYYSTGNGFVAQAFYSTNFDYYPFQQYARQFVKNMA